MSRFAGLGEETFSGESDRSPIDCSSRRKLRGPNNRNHDGAHS
ncbi:MAG: hypothetical protein VX635_01900 [Actinomycetota bacterium]|nr:hypothetical protein [Actinomycetota bacterium]